MNILNPSDIVFCPHCGTEQDGFAEDFVIPGRSSEPYDTECYECCNHFTVRQQGDQFIVEAV